MTKHLLWSFSVGLLALSCGGDDGGGGADGTGGDDGAPTAGDDGGGDSVSVEIDAAMGGTVALGGATLTIPPGALAETTTITVQTLAADAQPEATSIGAEVYDFGPDGLHFLVPVTLEIEMTEAVPEGQSPVIAFLEGGAWQPLGDSAQGSGTVSATTTHFTPFTVIFTADGQTAGGCDGFDFMVCGGDVVGTWSFTAACLEPEDPGEIVPGCPEATLSASVDRTGTVDFLADGTYSTTGMLDITQVITVPKSCLPAGAACAELDPENPPQDIGDACQQTTTSSEPDANSGTYVIEGNTIAFDDGVPAEYCVQGDTLKVLDTDGSVAGYEAQRQ